MIREKIKLNSTILELTILMAEGNPGAASVISKIIGTYPNGLSLILALDDMNMRGTQIWIGYKDHCKQNLDTFAIAVRNRDAEMIAVVNKWCTEEIAVAGGASFK